MPPAASSRSVGIVDGHREVFRSFRSTGKNFAAFLARRAAKSGEKKEKSSPPWERLRDVAVPMRLIYGKQDRAAAARAAILVQHMPAIDLHLVDRCAHMVMWDAPAELTRLAGIFLRA